MSDDEKLVSFEKEEKTYSLVKFRKTNQGTCINLNPIVKNGDKVQSGDPLFKVV